MTLEELKIRCEENNIQYAYGKFKEVVEPPHLVAITRDTENFMADNIVYNKNMFMWQYIICGRPNTSILF